MIRLVNLWFLLFLAFVVSSPAAFAQFTGSSQTNTISGVVSNWNGNYLVGDNFILDALQVINGGQFAISGYGIIGNTPNARNNSVLVDGSGSTWNVGADLYVGLGGRSNSLTIANGGAVSDAYCALVTSNNVVVVSGVSSVWSNTVYGVAVFGINNQIRITGGGAMYSAQCYMGSNSLASTAVGGSVLVSDNGSIWINSGDLKIGALSGRNSVIISNGGAVYSTIAYIGGPSPKGSNSVVVTGSGSVWNNQLTIYVGNSGVKSNSLAINDGGTVIASNMVVFPDNRLSLSNGILIVANGLTVSSNATLNGNATLIGATTIEGGGTLSPGFSPGSMTFSNSLMLAPSATLLIEMSNYVAGVGGYDRVMANAATVNGAKLKLQLLGGFIPTNGAQFVILDNFGSGAIAGTFAGATENSTNDFGSGVFFIITYAGDGSSGSGNDIVLTVLPEPATWLLVVSGFSCLPLARRSKVSGRRSPKRRQHGVCSS